MLPQIPRPLRRVEADLHRLILPADRP
jgi:hypothetical protein